MTKAKEENTRRARTSRVLRIAAVTVNVVAAAVRLARALGVI
jgi:hypothetical protein